MRGALVPPAVNQRVIYHQKKETWRVQHLLDPLTLTQTYTELSLSHTSQIPVAPSGNKCIRPFNESHIPKKHTHSILALPNTCCLLLISVPFHQLLHLTLSTPPPSITHPLFSIHPSFYFVSILLSIPPSISWFSGRVLTRAWP